MANIMKAPCDIASYDTVKYIDKNNNFVLKCKGWKDAKSYKIKYKKEDILTTKNNIRKEIAKHKEIKEKNIAEYQKLFVQKILNSAKNDAILRKIMRKINAESYHIGILEASLNSLGNIPPKNIRYYEREISF